MSIRLFSIYLKVPIILLAMIEVSLLVFAPFMAGAILYQERFESINLLRLRAR